MKMMLNLAKAGLKPCGKLLGKNKAGIELYEQLFENQRVLTSFKDGKLYKRCVRSNNENVIKLNTENFNTGDVVEITKASGKDSQMREYRILDMMKKDGKTGNTERLYYDRRDIGKEWDSLNNTEFKYTYNDVQNGKVFSMQSRYNDWDLRIKASQKDLSGNITDYVLPNGSVIPKDKGLYIYPVLAEKPVLRRHTADNEVVQVENSEGLAKFFVDFAKKMCGFKS